VYFAVQWATAAGAEVEGGAVSLSASGPVFFALNLGTAAPPSGTYLVAALVGARWVFRYDG
jgi:hypothetical protein